MQFQFTSTACQEGVISKSPFEVSHLPTHVFCFLKLTTCKSNIQWVKPTCCILLFKIYALNQLSQDKENDHKSRSAVAYCSTSYRSRKNSLPSICTSYCCFFSVKHYDCVCSRNVRISWKAECCSHFCHYAVIMI